MLDWLTHSAGYWAFTVACILFLAPLERLFPRIRNSAGSLARIRTVAAIGLLTIAVSYAGSQLQMAFVSLFLHLKIFSIAKLDIAAPGIFAIGFLLIDFLLYALHRLSHVVGFLWRIHAVHHADEHVTAISGLLHHPLETFISFVFVLFFAVILGVPVLVLMIYALTAAAHNAFAHADIALPKWIDRPLRCLIVTPDVHRTHHSVRMDEGNSNFGQVFTIWDRLLGTYVDRPSVPEPDLIMGLPRREKPKTFAPVSLLALPFTRRP